MGSEADAVTVGLAEAIRALRAELSQATAESADQEVRFRVGTVELEFEVEVAKEAGGSGGVKFWVVSAEAKAGVSRTGTHRVKLELHPMTKNPQTGQEEDARVSDHVSDRPR